MSDHEPISSSRVLLIGWDGGDWRYLRPLCEKGLLPALTHLARNGVAGELTSLSAQASTALWASVVTGKRPWKHGILGPQDEHYFHSGQPVPALWNILSSQRSHTHVVNWPWPRVAEHTNGVCVSEKFFSADDNSKDDQSALPARFAKELSGLRVKPNELNAGLVRLLIPEINRELLQRDSRIAGLIGELAEIYSVHNVTASLLETEPWDFACVRFRLVDRLLRDFGHFTAPGRNGASRAERNRYAQAFEGALRIQDLLLADLLKAAGQKTTVFLISIHGNNAAKPVQERLPGENQPLGIFVGSGPGLHREIILHGANILDIAPTILHTLQLPAGADMDGRVLAEIFNGPVSVKTIPTRAAATNPATSSVVTKNDIKESDFSSFQSSLSGTDDGPDPSPQSSSKDHPWRNFYLGADLFEAGYLQEALPYLEKAVSLRPENPQFAFWLARCQARQGNKDALRETLQLLDDHGDSIPSFCRLRGLIALESGKPFEALKYFESAQAHDDNDQHRATWKAIALQQTGKWLDAFEILKLEVTRRPLPETWLAIARCYLWAGRPRGAVLACKHAIAGHPRYCHAHLTLAQSFAASGKLEEAWTALLDARRLNPKAGEVRAIAEMLFPNRIAELGFSTMNGAEDQKTLAKSGSKVRPPQDLKEKRFEKKTEASSPSTLTSFAQRPELSAAYHYRPPEKFELERFNELLNADDRPDATCLSKDQMRMRVWETSAPRRFAGACWWIPVEKSGMDPKVEVRFKVRRRFQQSPIAQGLLKMLFCEIRNAGFEEVHLVLQAGNQYKSALETFGLEWKSCDELWSVDALEIADRMQATAAHWANRIPPGWHTRPIVEADWDFIQNRSGASDFLNGLSFDRVRHHLDYEISSIVESPDGKAGVLLTTRMGMTVVLEFMGAALEKRRWSALMTYLAVRHLCRRDSPATLFDRLVFTTDPARSSPIRIMAKRFNGTLLKTCDHYSGHLIVSGKSKAGL